MTNPRNDPPEGRPREINMTDLGWTEEQEEERPGRNPGAGSRHAAGTPGGGTASGGLAGTNTGDGDPDNADLDDALGSGLEDTAGENQDDPAYGGPSGGAVGGTPAGRRAAGGRTHRGLAPGGERPIDSTLGEDPEPAPSRPARRTGTRKKGKGRQQK
jgi:hypothetical protein